MVRSWVPGLVASLLVAGMDRIGLCKLAMPRSAVGRWGTVGLPGLLPHSHEVRTLFHPLQTLQWCQLRKCLQALVADRVGALAAPLSRGDAPVQRDFEWGGEHLMGSLSVRQRFGGLAGWPFRTLGLWLLGRHGLAEGLGEAMGLLCRLIERPLQGARAWGQLRARVWSLFHLLGSSTIS